MTSHSNNLVRRIAWTEEPGGLQSTVLQSWTGLKRLCACASKRVCIERLLDTWRSGSQAGQERSDPRPPRTLKLAPQGARVPGSLPPERFQAPPPRLAAHRGPKQREAASLTRGTRRRRSSASSSSSKSPKTSSSRRRSTAGLSASSVRRFLSRSRSSSSAATETAAAAARGQASDFRWHEGAAFRGGPPHRAPALRSGLTWVLRSGLTRRLLSGGIFGFEKKRGAHVEPHCACAEAAGGRKKAAPPLSM